MIKAASRKLGSESGGSRKLRLLDEGIDINLLALHFQPDESYILV